MDKLAPDMHQTARRRPPAPERQTPQPAEGPRLLAVGQYEMRQRRAGAARSQPAWLIELVLRGEFEVCPAQGRWQTCRRGSGLLYAPHTPYRERTTRHGAVCRSVGVLFEVGTTTPFRQWANLQPSFRRLEDPREQMTLLAEQLLRQHGTGQAGDLLAQGCFLQILGQLLQSQSASETWTISTDPPNPDLVGRTHHFMRANMARPLRLKDLAHAAGFTESGFAHAYKRHAGHSPMTALRRIRVEAVKFHLYSNRFTLSEIAQLTGFHDAFHLSRTFKQLTGISPRNFRRQIT